MNKIISRGYLNFPAKYSAYNSFLTSCYGPFINQQRQIYTTSALCLHSSDCNRYPNIGNSNGLLRKSLVSRRDIQPIHNWKRQLNEHDQRRKVIPTLVYLHNPWKYLLTKVNLWKLRMMWDHDFVEEDFIRGSKQAAVIITNIIRTQDASKISDYTTPIGFQQITRDMLLSRNDSRLKLIKFEVEHLRRAIPMKVATRKRFDRRFCFIDMLFVGLRNTKDFDTPEEVVEINEILRKMDIELHTPRNVSSVPHRIVFAEIFMRFRRDYSEKAYENALGAQSKPGEWFVSFYKILTFDVLNYDPKR